MIIVKEIVNNAILFHEDNPEWDREYDTSIVAVVGDRCDIHIERGSVDVNELSEYIRTLIQARTIMIEQGEGK